MLGYYILWICLSELNVLLFLYPRFHSEVYAIYSNRNLSVETFDTVAESDPVVELEGEPQIKSTGQAGWFAGMNIKAVTSGFTKVKERVVESTTEIMDGMIINFHCSVT